MRFFLFSTALFIGLGAWATVHAQGTDFVPLTAIPGVTTDQPSFIDYLNALFRIAIGVGALLAVVKITYAGIKYMTSEAFTSKEDAKKDIWGAVLGLIIILSTVIILQIINPDILNLDVLGGLPDVISSAPTGGGTGGGGGGVN